ncbi:MAG: efflux RND transporter periplasmic adaptor subunit [Candidatus Aminicenantaceae bacterium]
MIFPKKILIISLAVIVCGILVFFIFFQKKSEPSPDNSLQGSSPQVTKAEEVLLPVKVIPAKRETLIIKLKSPGEAVTNRKIIIKAEVSGIIKDLNVEEGKHVEKGELLVVLDDKEYRLELEGREASRLKHLSELFLEKKFAEPEKELSPAESENIIKAKEGYKKASQLYDKGLLSKEEFEKAKRHYEFILIEAGEKKEEIMAASLTQAEVEVKIAQMNLEKTKIRAPFSGIICDIKVSPQEHVVSQQELFTLVNISRIRVEARVLESEIGKMKLGREVDLKFSAYPGRVFRGRVKAISPIVNPEDKTCKVIIDLPNPKEEIKPGMHAEVEIAAEIHESKILIPQGAYLVRAGRKLAFVVEEGLAKWRYIEVGLENEDYAEVLDGIKVGELVIVEGHFTLAHDTRVRIVK